jgi:pimeloyl-ACP methyl ester carboxylesterase
MPAPVLLVHGFASSFERNWREPGWVDLLSDAGREVIATDLLGHGTAPKPHDPAEYVRLESDLAGLLPADAPVDAIGFSLGARLLLSIAATRRPGAFGRIVVGGVGESVLRDDDSEPVARAVEGSAAGPVAAGPGVGGAGVEGGGLASDRITSRGAAGSGEPPSEESNLARAFARFARTPGNDPLALAACLRRPVAPLTAEGLGRVSVPVLVVLGDQDFAGPAQPLVDALPDATLVVLEGVDHLATPMHFGFIDAALGFLGALPA